MAIAFRSKSTLRRGSSGSSSITKPTGTAAGDVLILVINSGDSSQAIPSGFTKLGTSTAVASASYQTVAYKVAGSSEPTTYSLSTSTGYAALLAAYSGAAGAPGVFQEVANRTTNVSTLTPASVTTTIDASRVLVAATTGNTTGISGSGWTLDADYSDSTDGAECFICGQAQAVAGPSSTTAITWATASTFGAMTLVLAPLVDTTLGTAALASDAEVSAMLTSSSAYLAAPLAASASLSLIGPNGGPITFINASSAHTTAVATQLNVPEPAGVQAGDLLVMVALCGQSGNTPNAPAGWTSLGTQAVGNSSANAWYRFASQEPASVTLTYTSSALMAVTMAAYRNADWNQNFEFALNAAGTGNISLPGGQNLYLGDTEIGLFAVFDTSSNASVTPPAGWNLRQTASATSAAYVGILDQGPLPGGAVANATAANSDIYESYTAWTLAVVPVGASFASLNVALSGQAQLAATLQSSPALFQANLLADAFTFVAGGDTVLATSPQSGATLSAALTGSRAQMATGLQVQAQAAATLNGIAALAGLLTGNVQTIAQLNGQSAALASVASSRAQLAATLNGQAATLAAAASVSPSASASLNGSPAALATAGQGQAQAQATLNGSAAALAAPLSATPTAAATLNGRPAALVATMQATPQLTPNMTSLSTHMQAQLSGAASITALLVNSLIGPLQGAARLTGTLTGAAAQCQVQTQAVAALQAHLTGIAAGMQTLPQGASQLAATLNGAAAALSTGPQAQATATARLTAAPALLQTTAQAAPALAASLNGSRAELAAATASTTRLLASLTGAAAALNAGLHDSANLTAAMIDYLAVLHAQASVAAVLTTRILMQAQLAAQARVIPSRLSGPTAADHGRTWAVAAENRALTLTADHRLLTLIAPPRLLTVPAEPRLLEAT